MNTIPPNDRILLAGRALLASLFIVIGATKLLAVAGFTRYFAAKGMPLPEAMPYVAFVIEVGGGLVLLLGIKTRTMAVLFSLYTLAATLISHRFWASPDAATQGADLINFFKNLAIIGGFTLLFGAGGGRYSVDAWRAARRDSPQ